MTDHQPRSARSDILFATAVALFVVVCWVLRSTLLLIYVSIVFAVVFTPAVNFVRRIHLGHWRPGRGVAILLLIAAVLAVFTVFGLLIVPAMVGDVQDFSGELPRRLEHLRQNIRQYPFGDHIAGALNLSTLEGHLAQAAQAALKSAQGIAGGLADLLLIILMTAYFILDGENAFRWAASLLPRRVRPKLSRGLSAGANRMQKWLSGQALLMLILGSSSFIVFWALGIRYFYGLGVFAGLANFVPIIGPLATVIVAGVVAALDSGMKLLGVIIFYAVYQQVENAYLTPRIMQSTVQLSPIAVIVALTVGGALAGVMGAIVAVPTAALIGSVIEEFQKDEQLDATTAIRPAA